MYIRLLKNKNFCAIPAPRSPARAVRYFFRSLILVDTILLAGVGPVPQERLMAWRVQRNQRWDACVGPGCGQPGSSAMKWRSLAVDLPCASQTFPGVRHDMAQTGGRSHAEERLGEAAAILMISRRRKATSAKNNVRTQRRTSWGAAPRQGAH
jgi:hypothetical protein